MKTKLFLCLKKLKIDTDFAILPAPRQPKFNKEEPLVLTLEKWLDTYT